MEIAQVHSTCGAPREQAQDKLDLRPPSTSPMSCAGRVHEPGDLPDSVQGLFRLDPADQVLPADRIQQGRMVGGHVPPDHPDHLVIVIAAGHETAFASDQLHPRASYSGCLPQRNARMLA